MKNYKIVVVYSGYGEMDICGVYNREGESLKEVIDGVKEENRLELGEEGKSYWEEFCSFVGVNDVEDRGYVNDGEEGFRFVFGEKSEWFKKIDNKDKWSEEEWNKWVELCVG